MSKIFAPKKNENKLSFILLDHYWSLTIWQSPVISNFKNTTTVNKEICKKKKRKKNLSVTFCESKCECLFCYVLHQLQTIHYYLKMKKLLKSKNVEAERERVFRE